MKCPDCNVEMDYVRYYDEYFWKWSTEFKSDKNGMIYIMFCPECGRLKVVKEGQESNV